MWSMSIIASIAGTRRIAMLAAGGIAFILLASAISISNPWTVQALADKHGARAERPEPFLFVGDAFDATFLQPTAAHAEWSESRWRREFARMAALGTRALIVQWSEYQDVPFHSTAGDEDAVLDRVAAAANFTGIDLYLGLALGDAWAEPQTLDGGQIARAIDDNRRVATILHQRFAVHPRFRGWYIPQELTDGFYNDEQKELILGLFAQTTALLRQLDPLKPILASGYTDPAHSHLVTFTLWWTRVFDESGIDILLFQDRAGISHGRDRKPIAPYLEAISMIDDEYFSGDVWFIAEIFTQVDGPEINGKPFRAVPAGYERVAGQLSLLGEYGKAIASYAYFPYMQSDAGPAAEELYKRYKAYVADRVKTNKAAAPGAGQ